jgi:hypothetical protein
MPDAKDRLLDLRYAGVLGLDAWRSSSASRRCVSALRISSSPGIAATIRREDAEAIARVAA